MTEARRRGEPSADAAREVTNSGLPDEEVRALTQDNRGRIWVSTAGGLAYFET